MDLNTVKTLIQTKLVKNGRINRHYSRKDWRDKNNLSNLYDFLNEKFPDISLAMQVDIILNHDGRIPSACVKCGSKIEYDKIGKVHCRQCVIQIANEKREKTNLKKYGGKSPNSSDQILRKTRETKKRKYGSETWNNSQKAKETNLERYGVEHPAQSDEVKMKTIKTNLERYGEEHVFQASTTKEKIKNAMNERYGVDHPMYSSKIKQKQEQTNLSRFGSKNVFQSDTIKEKISNTKSIRYGNQNFNNREKTKETNLERYGVENVSQSNNIRNTIIRNNLETYGVKYPIQLEEIQALRIASFKENKRKNLLKSFNDEQLHLLDNIDLLYREHIDNQRSIIYLASKYGFSSNFLRQFLEEKGYKLEVFRTFSKGEKDFADLLEKVFGFGIIQNDRTILAPKEIDIYIPESKLGIEYHGSYWHSVDDEDVNNSHISKFLLSKEKGIRLLQLFDREIDNKKEIVLSMIANHIKSDMIKQIHARKCVVKEINSSQYKDFCNKNHMQGYTPASIKIGLFFKEELVSVMSFGKSRFSKKHQYEMIRFCNKLYHNVTGAMSKLFSNFVRNYDPETIVTYADARFFNGESYKNLGFEFSHHTLPNYWYVSSKTDELESRIKYQKHKLQDLLENFDPKCTEKKNMIDNGYRIAYDAGNLVYTWSKNDK